MAERDDTRRTIEDERESMTEIAEELSRRTTPEYVKGRARAAVARAGRRTAESSLFWGIAGGLAAAAAATLIKRMRAPDDDAAYFGYEASVSPAGYFDPGQEMGSADAKAAAGERLRHMKEAVGEKVDAAKRKVGDLKAKVGDKVGVLRDKTTQAYDDTLADRPLVIAIGALGIGALLGAVLPVTNQERRLMRPVKDKALAEAEKVKAELSKKIEGEGAAAEAEGADDELPLVDMPPVDLPPVH